MLASCLILVPAAITTLSVPLSQTFFQLMASFTVYGFCFGFYEAGCSVYLLQLWHKSASPFLQALQFMFGIGSLLAPVIARPFLNSSSLMYPYAALAGLILLNSVLFFATWYFLSTKDCSDSCDTKANEDDSLLSRDAMPRKWQRLTVVLTFLFMHIYLGIEVAFGSFIMTFAVRSELHMSKGNGALLTTLFWGTFTMTKLAAVFLVQVMTNELIIALSIMLMMISNTILLIFGQESEVQLFFGVALMGIAISSIFGCIYAFLDQYVVVCSAIGSGITLSSVLGEVTFPAIMSLFIDSNPMIIMWISFVSSCSMAIIFLIIYIICRLKLNPK